jgi:translocation and assembly module TamB
MRRWRKIALWIVGVVVGLPVVLVAAVIIALNFRGVQRLVETEVPALTGGMVHIAGLHGRFPDAPRLDHVDVADAHGIWLRADAIALDWSPSALVRLRAQVDNLSVGHVSVSRRPVAGNAATPPQQSGGGFALPVTVDVRVLRVDRADIAAPVAGSAFATSLHGNGRFASLQDAASDISVARLDAAGSYHIDGSVHGALVTAQMSLQEPAGGLLAAIGKLQLPGPIAVTAALDGPVSAENARLDATVGALRATVTGSADLPAKTLALDVAATAPAMRPRPDIGWQSLDAKLHVAGPFATPDASGHVTLTGLQAGSAGLASLQADLAGNAGSATVHAVLTGLRIPGKRPDVFAAAPVDVRAAVNLAAAARPVNITLSHPLLRLDATATSAGVVRGQAHMVLPDLAPLAATAGSDVRGHADLLATLAGGDGGQNVLASGTVTIDGGATPPPGLRGDTKFDVDALLHGGNVDVRHAALDGRNLHADIAGSYAADHVALKFSAAVPDFSVFAAQAEGHATATGAVTGPPQKLKITADIEGDAGSKKYGHGPLSVTLDADDVPVAPRADLNAKIFVAGDQAVLAATAATDDSGTLHATVDRADWKSLRLRADVSTPKGGVPAGKIEFTAATLADLNGLTGQTLAGSLRASLVATAHDATASLTGKKLAAGNRRIESLAFSGRASGLQADPDLNGTLTLAGIDAANVTGSAKIIAAGRTTALQLGATVNLQNLQGAPANIASSAVLDAKTRQATLKNLSADWKDLSARLLAPSRLEFGERIGVDRLRVAVNDAILEVAGQFSPALNATVTLRNVTPALAKSVAPGVNAAGVLNADARLGGTPAAPTGVVHVAATGLRSRTGAAASLPAATMAATVTLAGRSASIDAHVDAGPKLHLAVSGSAPLGASAALAVRTTGTLDLALANPVLQADGRQARGRAALDLTVTGTPQAPRVGGSVTLANADIQDFAQGLHLDKINGRIDATGDSLTLSHLTADAGPGTIAVGGTVGIGQTGIPVDLHVTARNARPLASDLLTSSFDADLTLRGAATGAMDATGSVKLRRMDINIPDSLPPSVAVLHVRRPGDKPPPVAAGPAAPASSVRLAIDVDAPDSIFVRGKGLNAEMGGTLRARGTSARPDIEGGFLLRRGDFSLAGTTLNFTKGEVSFNGTGVNDRIDPTLDFEADSYSGNITATLKITGYADAPKIALSSVPDLPQDEVLAHLLFGQSMSQLSPLQIAEIGAALAEISGLTGGGEGPLGAIRKGLGLDRLSVGGGSGGAGTSVEAGRYVAKGVYVGTKQSTSGGGGTQVQVQVQIDLTRRLKLNTTLGSGGGTAQGATPDNDPGTSIGLSYGFEY